MNHLQARTTGAIWTILAAGVFLTAGCRTVPQGDYMALEFEPNSALRYRFVSSRDVEIVLTTGTNGKKEDSKISKESLELVMQIRPLEINPYGLTTLEFFCESANVRRTSFSGKPASSDAMESLEGKRYTLQISPTGRIENLEGFETLLKEIGQTSFVQSTNPAQRVKNPDMILDWIFFQYALWDVPASHPNPLAGIRPGSSWQSEQFLPWPVPIQNIPSRITTYTVREITEQDSQKIALLDCSFQLREKPVLGFPLPYKAPYQIKGSLFSVLRNFRHESLTGSGTRIFNLTDGILEQSREEYTLVTRADFILPLGQSVPTLTVRQSMTIERLDNHSIEGQSRGSQ